MVEDACLSTRQHTRSMLTHAGRDIREESDAVEDARSSFQKDGAVGRVGLHTVPNLPQSSDGALGRLDGKQIAEHLRHETMNHAMKIESKLHHAFWHPRMLLKGP